MALDWEKMVIKLSAVFQDDQETFARVLFYLAEEEKVYKDADKLGPQMKILMSSMNVASLFSQYAKRFAEDTKRADSDEKFKRVLGLIWAQMMDVNKQTDDKDKTPDVSIFAKLEHLSLEASPGMVRALSIIPYESQKRFLVMLKDIVPTTVPSNVMNAVVSVNKGGGAVVTVALASIHLTYEAIVNIRRWWNGEISGKRCCKTIIDSLATIGGSVGGGFAGVVVGALGGPVGMIIGAIGGGILGGQLAKGLSQWMTEKIFDVPKSEALENAYNFFNLRNHASNHQINTAYRQKCLEYHPDRRGSEEMFHKVQMEMAVIKAAKGELYS
ncbi:uncharacterized protein LOC126883094 [Diabrotica virgifera virgifera]|uniref:J domain-containing protein n=1 Tax=Diabrotica virgifera virgifera TaxID=50390 RepID=A0ABM5K272_DIAVI|nr:uncharacterized protein LOC126883094 [Diabrotica virgifera virgifera]